MPADVTRLPSGLTIATERMPHIQTAAVQVWVHAGSRSEQLAEHGIAHVLEHMAFKGTTRRTATEIKEEIAAVGGFIGATTSYDDTVYSARVLRADVPLALDILADILVDPTFDPAELSREEEVIVQELRMREDNPNTAVMERLLKTAYPGQSIGRPIGGTMASVRSFGRDNLVRYRARTYHAPATVVVAAGAVDHDAVVRDAEARFAAFKPESVDLPAAGRFTAGMNTERRDMEQVHLAIGLPGVGATHPDRRAHQIFAHILGGGMSSRLFLEAREKRGLCYAVGASHSEWSDTGLFLVYSATDAERAPDLIAVIGRTANQAADEIDEKEVNRAKAQFKSGMLMAMETADARASSLAEDLIIRGRPISIEESAASVDAVTVEGVRAAGQSMLASGRPAVSVLGPEKGIVRANDAGIAAPFAAEAA